MPTAVFFRAKAQQCRELLAVAKVPEVIAQLEVWICELEEAARQAEAMVVPVIVVTPKSSEGK